MRYDTIIVGAGSAGAILAARLTEEPDRQVLLLEAGPDYPDVESLPDEVKLGYGYQSTPRDRLSSPNLSHFIARATARGRPMIVPRGRVTGGSSAVNAQIFLRGVPEDYDEWAQRGATTAGDTGSCCPTSAVSRPMPTSAVISTAWTAPR